MNILKNDSVCLNQSHYQWFLIIRHLCICGRIKYLIFKYKQSFPFPFVCSYLIFVRKETNLVNKFARIP